MSDVDEKRPRVNIAQACDIAGVSRRTVYNWLNDGRLEYVRTAGGAIRIYRDTLFCDDGLTNLARRVRRFNDGTGVVSGGNSHPDRCVCQEKETGSNADTPHKHYGQHPHMCARCGCKAYKPVGKK